MHRALFWLVIAATVALASGCIGSDFPEESSGQDPDGGADAAPDASEGCDDDGDCDNDLVCDEDENSCVECAGDEDCDDGVCDTDENVCVECTDHDDCEQVDASACGEDNKCVGCTVSDECAHLRETPVCDADESQCVECTPEDEAKCDGDVCDPETFECADFEQGSSEVCEPCITDSQCKEDHRCVKMYFQDSDDHLEDGYCLKEWSTGCDNPFRVQIANRESLTDGSRDDYCGIDEDLTTCEAVLDRQSDKSCAEAGDDDCGVDELDDGRCEFVRGSPDKCTYTCDEPEQCKENDDCGLPTGETGDDYCGGL